MEDQMKTNYSIKSMLDNPIIYSYTMKILGSGRNKSAFINDYVKPKSREKLLDFGCGPATILEYLPQDIKYTGIDFNEDYIKTALQKYGCRGTFVLGDVSEESNSRFVGQFDIVLAHGLLHHLSDIDAVFFLKNAYQCLKTNGRLITLDNVYDEKFSLVNKIALKMDRGAYIRKKTEYLDLFSPFPNVNCNIVKTQLRIPYYHIICEVTRG
jgi:SAM-dependent methyltransferase